MSKRKKKQDIKLRQRKKLKNNLKLLFSYSASNLDAVSLSMRLILIGLCKRNHVEYLLDDKTRVDYLSNLATIQYTYSWLASDHTAYQNLHAFCREKFLPQGRESAADKDSYGIDYNTMYKSKGRFDLEDKLILEQAIAEKRAYPHNSKKMNTQGDADRVTIPTSRYNSLLHFFRLWKLDRYNKGEFLILQLLFERKAFMGTTSKRDGNNSLRDAYVRYYQIFKELEPKKNKLTDEEYVVTCFMAHELEYTYRFHLCAVLSKYMKDQNIPVSMLEEGTEEHVLLSEKAKYIWSRFAESPGFNTPITSKRVFEYVSYDILHYQKQISGLLFSTKDLYDKNIVDHLLDIALVRNMVAMLLARHPVEDMPSWLPEDYHRMRDFFQTRYPIYKIYSQMPCDDAGNLNLGEVNNASKDTCYDYIRKFQKLLIHMGDKDKYNPDSPSREEFMAHLAEYRKLRRISK